MDEPSAAAALFRHTRRHEWGYAILARDSGDRREYQFQDGKLRTFKQGYYGLLEEVDLSSDELDRVSADLAAKLDVVRARQDLVVERSASVMTLDQQVKALRKMFPEGFDDPAWLNDVRGDGSSKRLKKHRTQALETAKAELACDVLDALISEGKHGAVREAAARVLRGTTLSSASRDMESVASLPAGRDKTFAVALRDLLYGDGPYAERFSDWIAVLSHGNEGPTWSVSTTLPALVHEFEHVCVRGSSFRTQAKWMAPRIEFDQSPTAELYEALLEMARSVDTALRERGLEPRDLVDVYDFVRLTLTTKARALASAK